jgi:exopolysaccharide biosynthesis predicted pyruvyltransferase EpsI
MTHSSIEQVRAELLRKVASVADPRDGCALLDFPDFANPGDSLVWLGALAFLKQEYAVSPNYVAARREYCPYRLRTHCPSGPIYLNGGGNFGERDAGAQTFFEKILAEFPDRRVIQLPVSIDLLDESAEQGLRDAIRRHGNSVILVRDTPSLAAAEKFGCETHLCPDMAFALGQQSHPSDLRLDAVLLLRADRQHEGSGEYQGSTRTIDWHEDDFPMRAADRALRPFRLAFSRVRPLYRMYVLVLTWLANRRARRGKRMLAPARHVITDRLHAHILASMMGIPNVAIDKPGGKIARFLDTWTGDIASVKSAPNLRAALECLPKLR